MERQLFIIKKLSQLTTIKHDIANMRMQGLIKEKKLNLTN